MAADVHIREEVPADAQVLHKLTYDAFLPMSFSDDSEADALDRLRADGDLLLSLVAEHDGEIVGHAAFSPIPSHEGWVALGPISVRADVQKRGIGRRLIADGLAEMKKRRLRGCILTGNPDVYKGSGFRQATRLSYGELPNQYIQYVSFSDDEPSGPLEFAPGLESTAT